jgi:SRF-type transcription factor (DNA-binding and dimerisation domain)
MSSPSFRSFNNLNLAMSKIPKGKSERLNRRKDTLIKKAYEMGFFCDVDVALVLRIRKTGRIITFNTIDSKSSESWPPSKEQIVSTCLPNMKGYPNRVVATFLSTSSKLASARY